MLRPAPHFCNTLHHMQEHYKMGRMFEKRQLIMEYPALRFMKTGKQIAESLGKVIEVHEKFTEDAREQVTEICKRRELSPEEVLATPSDDPNESNMVLEAFETRAVCSVGGSNASNAVIRELQADLNKIRELIEAIGVSHREVLAMRRIQTNIEPDRKFDLSHSELVSFGF